MLQGYPGVGGVYSGNEVSIGYVRVTGKDDVDYQLESKYSLAFIILALKLRLDTLIVSI